MAKVVPILAVGIAVASLAFILQRRVSNHPTPSSSPTPLTVACAFGFDEDIAKALRDGANPNEWSRAIDPMDGRVSGEGRPQYIKPLSQLLGRIGPYASTEWEKRNPKNDIKKSALYRSVELMLDHGADPFPQESGGSALHYVAEIFSPAYLELIIRHTPNVMIRDKEGRTALHVVAINHCFPDGIGECDYTIYRDIDIRQSVNLLVRAHIPVDVRDRDQRTPLHIAAFRGNLPMAIALIGNGARSDSKDCLGLTPIDCAKNLDVYTYLLKAQSEMATN